MKRASVLTPIVLAVICSACSQSYTINNVTKPKVITLKKGSFQGEIVGLSVEGSGNIDGAAEITFILNGEPYKSESLSGDVDFRWDGDWYEDSAQIEYQPTSVTSGTLSLKYKFKDL